MSPTAAPGPLVTPAPSLSSPARPLAEAACLLAFLGFALAVMAPVLAGQVPIPTDTLALWGPQNITDPRPVNNPVLNDAAVQNLPWQIFVRRSLAGGEWPLWDPTLFAGYPFLGNDQNQLYYPVAWLLLLLPLPAALQVNPVLHLWLAGAGMYTLARLSRTSRTGSVLAGLAFAGSSQLYTSLEPSSISNIYVWLPWIVAASEMAWRRRSWAWAAGAGLLLGVQGVAGHLPWFIYSGALLGAWLGARVAALAWTTARHDGTTWRAWGGQAARAGAILAGGPALAAIHLVPLLELARLSSRIGATPLPIGPDQFDRTFRLLARQLNLFVPEFFGSPVGGIVGNPVINLAYVGLAGLALALVALVLRRERRVWFLGAMGLSAFGMMAGLPLFNRLHTLPGLETQMPQRTAYLFIFCVALLSGLGFDAWLALARRHWRGAVVLSLGLTAGGLGIAALLADQHGRTPDPALFALQTAALRQAALIAAGLAGWVVLMLLVGGERRRWGRAVAAGALLGLTTADLLTYAPGYNTYVSVDTLQFHNAAADLLRADPQPWRMITADAPGPVFVPNMATLYALTDVQGYDSLHLARYETYWTAADPALRDGGYFNTVFRPQSYTSTQALLLNVRYLVTAQPLSPAPPASWARVYTATRDVTVYRNQAALPRAFVVGGAEVLGAEAIPARLAAPGFDPRRAVLLEEAPPVGFPTTPGDSTPPGTATITRYRNLSVDLTAQMDRPGWLVLGDVNYPGWTVTVDGQPAPLYTAYALVRAVPLAAGSHTVHFGFQPLSVLGGAVVSGIALLLALGMIGGTALRRRRAT